MTNYNAPNNLEGVVNLLEKKEHHLTLDDSINFKCRPCGKCCVETSDILLSPIDLFNLSEQLKMTSKEVIEKYGVVILGGSTNLPLVLLKRDKFNRCLLLKDNKCMVHEGKPGPCYLYPLGRVMINDKDNKGELEVKYIMQQDICNNYKAKPIKVRDYIGEKYLSQEKACINWLKSYGELSSNTIGMTNEFIENCRLFLKDAIIDAIIETLYIGLEEISLEDDLDLELEKRYTKAKQLLKDAVELDSHYKQFSIEEMTQMITGDDADSFASKILDFLNKYKRK